MVIIGETFKVIKALELFRIAETLPRLFRKAHDTQKGKIYNRKL